MKRRVIKNSLGTLRPAVQTKEKSPNLTGEITIQRSDFEVIERYFQQTRHDNAICGIAGWCYEDPEGKFIRVQISPPYVKQPIASMTLDRFFEEEENDEELGA